jgi:hypothetical protein
MNFSEIKNAVKHLLKTSTCSSCDAKYIEENVNIIATTKTEGLFEISCVECQASTIVTVMLSADMETKEAPANFNTTQHRTHREISQNEVLDMKNFLARFDGNFKKIFIKEK